MLISEAGFKDIYMVSFASETCKDLQIDRVERRSESLYVEARKNKYLAFF